MKQVEIDEIRIEANKNDILSLWKSIGKPWTPNGRQGIGGLIKFLETSDFFVAPCSTEYHLSIRGGLAEHSTNVYRLLKEKVEHYDLNITDSSIVICALGHDLCKANFYIKGTKNVQVNGKWEKKEVYKVNDQFPFGHGEKSVSILQDYIKLTHEEKLAIRWHMTAFDPGIHFGYPSGFPFREAAKRYPLVTLLFTADYEASNIVEN